MNSSDGYPLPGTRGTEGLAKDVVISASLFNFYAQQPATYTLTITKTPRPGYNIGGTSFADAPSVATNTTLYGSLHIWEPGQFYKVTIGAGQLIYISGQATGPAVGATFKVELYNSSQQLVKTLISNGVYATPTLFPINLNYDFYRNTGGAADYYLKLRTQFRSTLDFQIQARVPTQAQLTLLLDADNNFNQQNQQSDINDYVPGSILSTGESVPVVTEGNFLQQIKAIAAFIDESGQIIPPPAGVTSANFNLENTSAFTGYAMNAGASTTADFTIPSSYTSFSGKTATKIINVYDYGGFTTVRVTINGQPDRTMRVPKDDANGGNLLPDGGWRIYTGLYVTETSLASDDADPSGQNSFNGDGLVAFEEYRGFIVEGEHTRTDPRIKELFFNTNLPDGVGNTTALFIPLLTVFAAEMDASNYINFNFANGGYGGAVPSHYAQKAVKIDEGFYAFNLGETAHFPAPVVPSRVVWSKVYSERIRELSPPTSSHTTPEAFDSDVFRQTIGHEAGHHINLVDVETFGLCPAITWTVMITGYFGQSNGMDPNACAWMNVPQVYTQGELDSFRLR